MVNFSRVISLIAVLLLGLGQAKADGYQVIIGTFENGSVTASQRSDISAGTTVTLTVTPSEGYALSDIKAYRYSDTERAQTRTDPLPVGEPLTLTLGENSTYSFTMPDDDVVIQAVFAQLTAHTIESTGWGNYFNPPSSAETGATITLSNTSGTLLIPRVYYYQDENRVLVDVTRIDDDNYTFIMPNADVIVDNVYFMPIVQLSNNNTTLTIKAIDREEYQEADNIMVYQESLPDDPYVSGFLPAQQGQIAITDFITTCRANVQEVVFDENLKYVANRYWSSFARMFLNFQALTTITGLNNLDMSMNSSTFEMFANCSSLASLTIGSNFYIGSTENHFSAENMFYGCTALASGTLTITGTPTIQQNIFDGVFTSGSLVTSEGVEISVTEGNQYYEWMGGHFATYNGQPKQPQTLALTFSEGQQWMTYYIAAEENTDMSLPEGYEAFYVSEINMTNDQEGTITIVSTGQVVFHEIPTLIYRTENAALEMTATLIGINDENLAYFKNIYSVRSGQFIATEEMSSFGQQFPMMNTFYVLRDGSFVKAHVSTFVPHRCYIIQSNGNAWSRSLSLTRGVGGSDGTTGISMTQKDDESAVDGTIYDLQGRKLSGNPTQRGIYIQNRKKIIVK